MPQHHALPGADEVLPRSLKHVPVQEILRPLGLGRRDGNSEITPVMGQHKELVRRFDSSLAGQTPQKAYGRIGRQGNIHPVKKFLGIGVLGQHDARDRIPLMILKGDDIALSIDFLEGGQDVAGDDMGLFPAFSLGRIEHPVQHVRIAMRWSDRKGIFLPHGL